MTHSSLTEDRSTETFSRLSAVLAGEERRRILDYLETWGKEQAEIENIAVYVAACDVESTLSEEEARQRLYHVDLPHLDDAGIIEFDRRSGTVRYRGDPHLEKEEDRWCICADPSR